MAKTTVLTIDEAQAAMDAAVAAKAASDRDYKAACGMNDLELVAVINDAKDAHATEREILKNAHQAATVTHNQEIAKAGAMVRKASQAESRAKAEAKATAEAPTGPVRVAGDNPGAFVAGDDGARDEA